MGLQVPVELGLRDHRLPGVLQGLPGQPHLMFGEAQPGQFPPFSLHGLPHLAELILGGGVVLPHLVEGGDEGQLLVPDGVQEPVPLLEDVRIPSKGVPSDPGEGAEFGTGESRRRR